MNLLGPSPTSSTGESWIVVATDYLTRYAETDSVYNVTYREVANFFINNIVLRHGACVIVFADRGSAFAAELMQRLMRMNRTTVYNLQTNR